MCNCKSEIEAGVAARYSELTGATEVQVELQGYGFGIVGNTMVMRGCMPYKVSAVHAKKSGGTYEKRKTGVMSFTFCPFCGECFDGQKSTAKAASAEAPHA